jgi:predicted glutamine amidotransferase
MCGIVATITGFTNGFSSSEVDMFQDLLFMDQLRGTDGTGVMYGTNKGAVQVHKNAGPAWFFLKSKEWIDSSRELLSSGMWAVGHNRAATRGEKIDKNAHPFVVDDNIILVQNGTYKGSHKHLKNVDVDSEACAHAISEGGEDISKTLKTLDAAYAFMWYNVKEKSLYIIRNDERPLYTVRSKTGAVFFASEGGMITAAANRNNVALAEEPYMLKDSHLCKYTFDPSNGEWGVEFKDIDTKVDNPQRATPFHGHWVGGNASHAVNDRRTWRRGGEHLPAGHQYRRTTVMEAVALASKSANFPQYTQSGVESFDKLFSAKKNGTYMVEALDCVAAFPTDPKNSEWHIIGQIVDPNSSMDGKVVNWVVGGPEDETISYITDNMFRITPDFLNKGFFNGSWTISISAKDIEVIELVKETDSVVVS